MKTLSSTKDQPIKQRVPNNHKPKTDSATETISGIIERITFYNESNGFCVLKINGQRQTEDLITVIGYSPQVTAGEYIHCQGNWAYDKNHGKQFKATSLKLSHPTSIEGIEKYLGSGLIKGIGPAFAKRLIKALGIEILDIIEHQPERLKRIPGIGEQRYQQILDSWEQQNKVREIVMFLHEHGIGTSRAVRIYKMYGDQAISTIKSNPYQLALDIRGIGFKSADELAQKLNIPKDSITRACAGILHILKEYSSKGHCAILRENLVALAVTLLEVDPGIIETAINHEIARRNLVSELLPEIRKGVAQANETVQSNQAEQTREYIFLAIFYQQELDISHNIKRLSSYPLKFKFDSDNSLEKIQSKNKISLSAGQIKAIKLALTNKITIITGGPGVGKTTVINCILQLIAKKTQYVLLAAPTGRAAKRMAECCTREAKTLHRLLEFDPATRRFKRNEEFPLIADFVIIDESSMLDLPMMYSLLKAIPNGCNLVFIGDIDQLPSVGPGAVLKDFIASETIATAKLADIFRQASSSAIITNAHRINQGQLPILTPPPNDTLSDWYYIEANTPEDNLQKLIQVVSKRIPARFGLDPLRDIQVLTPMNKGSLGAYTINLELQKILNPETTGISKFGWSFKRGDKVMQIINNYDKEVFNGDIGYIKAIDQEEGQILIEFDNREIEYDSNELDEIVLAYATTIHKSQGSEFPAIVIPFAMQHYTLLERNLLYTAITRGKKLVVLIGQQKALSIAVKAANAQQRITNLKARLRGVLPVFKI